MLIVEKGLINRSKNWSSELSDGLDRSLMAGDVVFLRDSATRHCVPTDRPRATKVPVAFLGWRCGMPSRFGCASLRADRPIEGHKATDCFKLTEKELEELLQMQRKREGA